MTFLNCLWPRNPNPIHSLLDEIGVPWRSPRRELIEQFGVHADPAYQWDVVEIKNIPPIVDGLIKPLSTQVFPQFSPFVPATYFSAHSWNSENAGENLAYAEEVLARKLGKPRVENYSNCLGRFWAFGTASIRLRVWPPDMQLRASSVAAHVRDPRLATACNLALETGFRILPSAEEVAWMEQYQAIAEINGNRIYGGVTVATILETAAEQNELEFVREPLSDYRKIFGTVGYSRHREVLIFCHAQLYLIPMNDVLRFRVRRILPAKGPGGSFLDVECRTRYTALRTKNLTVSSGKGAEDLNAVAAKLGERTGKPVIFGEYEDDC